MGLHDIVLDHGKPSKAARNEVRKLSGAWLNSLSVALVAAGIIVPLVAFYPYYLEHASAIKEDPSFEVKLFSVCWISGFAFLFAIGLHLRALFIVHKLED